MGVPSSRNRAFFKVKSSSTSSGIADYAAEIIGRNGFREQTEVIHATIEDAQLPEPVDVILSEWMGCCLFF
jgi:hypothetical protein